MNPLRGDRVGLLGQVAYPSRKILIGENSHEKRS